MNSDRSLKIPVENRHYTPVFHKVRLVSVVSNVKKVIEKKLLKKLIAIPIFLILFAGFDHSMT